jgi:hypothetical protein
MHRKNKHLREGSFSYQPPSSRRGMMTNSDLPDEGEELEERSIDELHIREIVRLIIEQIIKHGNAAFNHKTR